MDQKESPVLFSVLNKSVIGQNGSKEAGPATGSFKKSHATGLTKRGTTVVGIRQRNGYKM